ncbi:MAG: phenylalanine--tRNA ligase subunit alpha [Candidatus Cloacimonetes bacterium]|nr:phenylalanine--tRNA ligase subunit alpha [Candidatus Cloacimonadota bacterium]
MDEQLQNILKNATSEIEVAKAFHELNDLKSRYIGKKSELNGFMQQMGKLSATERPVFGKKVNDVKAAIESLLEAANERIKENIYTQSIATSSFDFTMPGRPVLMGNLHPLTIIQNQIEDIFLGMGFQIAEGYDVEDDFHNFDALNHPKDHPARNLADTFYIGKDTLLRTHTSTVQIRTMEKHKPPIKIIAPGRCYRNDKFDLTHSPVFHQTEGLVVDEGISFKDLSDTMDIFLKKLFGSEVKSRFRPHFFPFTEPSAEIDVSCVACGGNGCPTCKNSGWIEILGAGMVDPNVFDILGIDSERYTGYAFGCGIDRLAMLKYKLPDIRLLYENDVRFLRQF